MGQNKDLDIILRQLNFKGVSEEDTKRVFVFPLLKYLEISITNLSNITCEHLVIFNDVQYFIDILLKREDNSFIVFEVKKLGSFKSARSKELKDALLQVSTYANALYTVNKYDVSYAIVTDGNAWYVYKVTDGVVSSTCILSLKLSTYVKSSSTIELDNLKYILGTKTVKGVTSINKRRKQAISSETFEVSLLDLDNIDTLSIVGYEYKGEKCSGITWSGLHFNLCNMVGVSADLLSSNNKKLAEMKDILCQLGEDIILTVVKK